MGKEDPRDSQTVGIYSPSQDLFAPKKPGGRVPGTSGKISNLSFSEAANRARRANEERYAQGLSLWDEIIQRYQPGGAFGAGAMASYERGKTKAVGAGMQQLVSAGLANTTVAATIGKKYEEEVGTSFRTQLADIEMGRLSEAQAGKAGFVERREDVGPDPNVVARAGQQAGYAQGAQTGGSGLVRNQPFPESAGIAEQFAWQISRGGGGGGGGYSPGRGGGRGGGGYDPGAGRTLDIGRITYQGEASRAGEFAPTGTGGEGGQFDADKIRKQFPEFAGEVGFEGMLRSAAAGDPSRINAWMGEIGTSGTGSWARQKERYRQKQAAGGGNAPKPGSWTSLSGAGGAGGGRF